MNRWPIMFLVLALAAPVPFFHHREKLPNAMRVHADKPWRIAHNCLLKHKLFAPLL